MRKATLFALFTLAVSLAAFADDEAGHQSFLSYDDGGTVIRSGEDGKEIDAQRNMPVYPGDELITNRRGRAEVRLSDGNVIGIDRATSLKFRSMLDSYEGQADETVAQLQYGKVAVNRTDIGHDQVRLDTQHGSYIATYDGIYSVETDSRGVDRVNVLDGTLEVRTPQRSSRLNAGQSANVDDRGLYNVTSDHRASADDFERWFVERSGRVDHASRYINDSRLSYWGDDLDDHGSWVFATGIGWSWRPVVTAGWRPYYNGYWYHRNGCLTWVSYDPFGWVPYHYGRWAFDAGYGWVWAPGYAYSPAWVYWMYGNNYVGWAPSGYWDCYRPYYDWAYRPYRHGGTGYGFSGRVHAHDMDLRPWTFVDPHMINTRADRAALTSDAVKQRLARNSDATLSTSPARFSRDEFQDPAEAIRRRALDGRDGRITGRETAAPPTDLTAFVRRDNEVSGAIRERIVRSHGDTAQTAGEPSKAYGGSSASTRGTSGVIDRGSTGTIGRTPSSSSPGGSSGNAGTWRSNGGSTPGHSVGGERRDGNSEPAAPNTSGSGRSRDTSGRINRGGSEQPQVTPQPTTSQPAPSHDDSWRNHVRGDDDSRDGADNSGAARSSGGSNDLARRIIDRIGGARVYPRESGTPRESGSSSTSRDSGSSSTSRDSGHRSEPRTSAPPPPPASSDSKSSGSRDSGSGKSSRSSTGSRESGGRIKKDH
jgi:hypothetical protein